MSEKINMKKGEIMYNSLRSSTLVINTAVLPLGVPILTVFKAKTKNSKNFDELSSIVIKSLNIDS